MVPIDLLDTGLPQTFHLLKNAVSATRNEARHGCSWFLRGWEKPCDYSHKLALFPPPPSTRVAPHFVSVALRQVPQAISALAELAKHRLPQ